MPRFYVTKLWDDWPEGGSYGTIIEADDAEKAEELCKLEMASLRESGDKTADSYLQSYGDEWDTVDCFDLDEFIGRHLPADLRQEIKSALEGDSNDAEHDALASVANYFGIEHRDPCDDEEEDRS